jgi:predicted DNA-binding transcriptional regulator YafY
MINYELEREILSYADSVKVIAPASLASPIRTRLADALNLY